MPDLPKANYDVWVRGYGLVDSPKAKATPGKTVNLKAVAAPDKKAAAQYYPAQYWFALLQMPPKSDFPGTGAQRQRHLAEHQEPGRVDSPGRQHRRLHRLPSDGRHGDAHDSGEHPRASSQDSKTAWDRRIQAGQAGGGMSARFTQVGRAARAGDVRGLDRSHRGRRTAGGGAGASAGPRAQRRHHDVGLGRSEGLPARRDRERQAQSHGERRTVRSTARSKRAPTTCRSSIRRRNTASQVKLTRPRSRDAELRRSAAGRAVAVLGRRSDLEQQDHGAQLRDGQAGPRLGGGAHPQAARRRPGAGPDRIIRRRSCSRSIRAAARPDDVRPEDEAD